MKQLATCRMLVCAVWLTLLAPALALAAPDAAAMRSYLYQSEARKVLESKEWRISVDRTGTLEATHPTGPVGANFPGAGTGFSGFALLTLTFLPKSATRTDVAANIVAYFYIQGDKQKKRIGPRPFNSPETTKDIQDMLAKAEKRMTAAHAEYSAQ